MVLYIVLILAIYGMRIARQDHIWKQLIEQNLYCTTLGCRLKMQSLQFGGIYRYIIRSSGHPRTPIPYVHHSRIWRNETRTIETFPSLSQRTQGNQTKAAKTSHAVEPQRRLSQAQFDLPVLVLGLTRKIGARGIWSKSTTWITRPDSTTNSYDPSY